VYVWRNFNAASPFAAGVTVAGAANNRTPDPPAITPNTANSVVMAIGAASHAAGGAITFSSAGLLNFGTIGANDTFDSSIGAGYFNWVSGTYNPSLFNVSTPSAGGGDSWRAATLAIRSKLENTPVYGPKRNSGIWDLATTASAPTIAGNNVFPQPRDIHAWASTASVNACTISRDTTVLSPFNNTTLKMVVSGADPYIISYGSPTWNIAAAAIGQTWEVSVWIKANLVTDSGLSLFEANSLGQVLTSSASTVTIGKQWRKYSLRRTFTNASAAFVQIRLDGPETNAVGQSVWFDGLQVRRIV
jgi:hypothetical protein